MPRISIGNGRAMGAGLVLFRPWDDTILLTRRSESESSPGYWDFPGGHVEHGESPIEAAIREGREELGGLPKIWVNQNPIWWSPNPSFSFASFLAQIDPSIETWEPVLNPEHDDFGWFNPKELPSPALDGARNAVRQFFRS